MSLAPPVTSKNSEIDKFVDGQSAFSRILGTSALTWERNRLANTLQHTATHCITLQHTVTHVSRTQVNVAERKRARVERNKSTTTWDSVLFQIVTVRFAWCGVFEVIAVYCNVLQYVAAVYCNVFNHIAVCCSASLNHSPPPTRHDWLQKMRCRWDFNHLQRIFCKKLACSAFFLLKILFLISLGCVWFQVPYSVYQFIGSVNGSNSNNEWAPCHNLYQIVSKKVLNNKPFVKSNHLKSKFHNTNSVPKWFTRKHTRQHMMWKMFINNKKPWCPLSLLEPKFGSSVTSLL